MCHLGWIVFIIGKKVTIFLENDLGFLDEIMYVFP